MKKKTVKATVKGKPKSKRKQPAPSQTTSDGTDRGSAERKSMFRLRLGSPPNGKQVAIFGAGISGLTAAHELIERGFRVEVFERDEVDPVQRRIRGEVCAIGGVARTQWGSIVSSPGRSDETKAVPNLPLLEIFFSFADDPDNDEPEADVLLKITALKAAINNTGAEYRIEVRGHSRTRSRREDDDLHAIKRAEKVIHLLTTGASPVPPDRLERIDSGLGRAGDWTAADADRDYVDFHVVQDILPGEHGFRFFPSFYRNLFDTLRRIPIADDRAEFHETPNTVLNNIVPTDKVRIGLVEQAKPAPERSFEFSRNPSTSLRAAFDLLAKILSSVECTVGDIAQHQLRLFKYMTSCPERRALEYEYQSWANFMDAGSFSDKFRELFDRAGQTNVAVRASECDARTYGNVSVQLFLDQIRLAENVDGTLNGPTSIAWFDHWRRYLCEQGVIFRRGELTGWKFFQYDPLVILPVPGPKPPPPEVWARVKIWRRVTEKSDPAQLDKEVSRNTLLGRDFYVVAIALQDAVPEASDPQAAPLFDGAHFPQSDFIRLRAFTTALAADAQEIEDLIGGSGHSDFLWLQRPLAGIQFFLPTDGGFVRGHTSYVQSDYRLSSISQPQFWFRRRGWWDGYRGVLSVDIGEWTHAWTQERKVIIGNVWNQVLATIQDKSSIPDHVAVHFDRCITFDPQTQKPSGNKAPYLVTRTSEFPKRPGRLDPDGYEVHHGKIVLAGTYMKTYTRLTTMESANESARHAVNGILKASGFKGARCAVSNPEEHEIEDLKVLVELDALLVGMGLPHFADILDLTEIPFAMLDANPKAHELLGRILEASTAKGG
jgi:hypothetical protein